MFAYFERDSFGARAEDAGRSCSLAARTLFEPLLADDVETDGHMGLTNSIRPTMTRVTLAGTETDSGRYQSVHFRGTRKNSRRPGLLK